MPKRPPPGRCVHCLKHFDTLTWDHVLPMSWYPDGMNNMEKWVVPACDTCNRDLGKIEEELLNKLGLTLDPQELSSLGIPDKTLRSLNPQYGRNNRDRFQRQKKREKVLKDIQVFQKLPQIGIFPNFGPLPNVEYISYPVVFIDPRDVEKFAEKIVRGIAYIADKSFIENYYKIELIVVEDDKATEIKDLVDKRGVIFERGPAFQAKRLLIENDPVGGIYFINIWRRFRFYVLVSPKDEIEEANSA